jgi:hypothetical protein
VTRWKVLAAPFGILLPVAAIIWVGLDALDANGSVGALGFIAIMIVAGILGGRAAEKWPASSPRR